ncbi:hypothetical protein BGW36DRAFT_388024 [Talaromyces proteolyticus]|uniref:Cupin type-2 domain-containing protein n=1 Tax=Talaromyces proteolyticus TaxID=1131652 RepID=A0AAD4KGA9_9EURO|nr:uncharacterized protein BGW36DRAFT_388024 [Talaromyces proteolyticus]KAH8691271.1 hypothetical protein BGW36DRAFT_388024 [Talaromyces proteolyticus]
MGVLPPIRRVVTGHDDAGRANIDIDATLSPIILPMPKHMEREGDCSAPGFTVLWRTDSSPAKNQGPWVDYHGKPLPIASSTGTTVRIVDFSPGFTAPFHRTISLDIGVVLVGEVVLELDDGVETTVRQGETIIQRGTIHSWHNRAETPARVLFVLLPSEKLQFDGQTLEEVLH